MSPFIRDNRADSMPVSMVENSMVVHNMKQATYAQHNGHQRVLLMPNATQLASLWKGLETLYIHYSKVAQVKLSHDIYVWKMKDDKCAKYKWQSSDYFENIDICHMEHSPDLVLPAGYPKLCSEPAPDQTADFIANRTKNNYIILEGINTQEAIDSVFYFAAKQGVWGLDDDVRRTRRPRDFKPDRYHDISFVLKFYNKARRAYEATVSPPVIPQPTPESRCADGTN